MNTVVKCLAILAICGLSLGRAFGDEAKSYKVTLHNVYKVGAVEFQPGEYKVLVDASQKVKLTEVKSGKAVDVEAKVETVDSKFDRTSITSRTEAGVSHLKEIQIGGSKTKIAFE